MSKYIYPHAGSGYIPRRKDRQAQKPSRGHTPSGMSDKKREHVHKLMDKYSPGGWQE